LAMLYREKGQFVDSLTHLKQAQKLGPGILGAPPYPVLIREAEQFVLLDAKLPMFLKGENLPAGVPETIALAALCQLKCRQLYVASTRFYREAFDADATYANNLAAGHRYNAACAAALAGSARGNDVGDLATEECARLRVQALAWLRADLADRQKQFASEP